MKSSCEIVQMMFITDGHRDLNYTPLPSTISYQVFYQLPQTHNARLTYISLTRIHNYITQEALHTYNNRLAGTFAPEIQLYQLSYDLGPSHTVHVLTTSTTDCLYPNGFPKTVTTKYLCSCSAVNIRPM